MRTFVVIPLHNEEKHISFVLKDILKFRMPVVVVDDGSTDRSYKIASKSRITLISHKINLGKGAAMKTGADYAFNKGADAVIFMDADGQHNIQNIKQFIEKLKLNKYSLVFGSRSLSLDAPLVRYLGNKIASIIIRILFGIYVSDPICGFRAMTFDAYKKIKWDSTGYGVETEILARVGKNHLKFIEIPVTTIYHDRDKGVTLLDAFGVLVDVLKWKLTL